MPTIIATATKIVSDSVKARAADGSERVLKAGDPLYLGDTLITGKQGFVKLTFNDGTILQFGPLSRASLDQYQFDPAQPEHGGRMEAGIAGGVFRYISGKISGNDQGHHTTLHTPSSTIGIRGSELDGKVEADGSTVIYHNSGIIDITSRYQGDTVSVFESGSTVYVPIQPLPPALNFTPAENLRQDFKEQFQLLDSAPSAPMMPHEDGPPPPAMPEPPQAGHEAAEERPGAQGERPEARARAEEIEAREGPEHREDRERPPPPREPQADSREDWADDSYDDDPEFRPPRPQDGSRESLTDDFYDDAPEFRPPLPLDGPRESLTDDFYDDAPEFRPPPLPLDGPREDLTDDFYDDAPMFEPPPDMFRPEPLNPPPLNEPPPVPGDDLEVPEVLARDDVFRIQAGEIWRMPQDAVLRNDFSGSGALWVADVFAADNGRVALLADGSIEFVPAPDYAGPAGFAYRVQDSEGHIDEARVDIAIAAPVRPEALPDAFITDQDTPKVLSFADLLGNDLPPGEIKFVDAFAGVNGQVTVDYAAHQVIFDPAAGYSGPASFSYLISDLADTAQATGSVELDVRAGILPDLLPLPVANADNFVTPADLPLTLRPAQLLLNDTPQGVTIDSVFAPVNGFVSQTSDGTIVFDPLPGFTGSGGFSYSIADSAGNFAETTVAVEIGGLLPRTAAGTKSAETLAWQDVFAGSAADTPPYFPPPTWDTLLHTPDTTAPAGIA